MNLVQRCIVKEKKIVQTSLFGKYLVFPVVAVIFFFIYFSGLRLEITKIWLIKLIIIYFFFTWKDVDLFGVGSLTEHAISTEGEWLNDWLIVTRGDWMLSWSEWCSWIISLGLSFGIKYVTIVPTWPKKIIYSFLFK